MTQPGSYTTIEKCRISDSADLSVILDLGRQPLANSLLAGRDQVEEVYPLRLGYSGLSRLVQLMETIPKEKLFRHYFWVSGTAATTREYAQDFCQRAMRALGFPSRAFVVEVASNDGTFLAPFRELGLEVLGIDPAQNIAADAKARGIETLAEFWDVPVAQRIVAEKGPADFVFARNVVSHVSELHEVIRGIYQVLTDHGLGMIEFHEAGRIMEELHYDSIYHEHLCYFSLHAMEYLLHRHGLHPYDLQFSPISGGSIVVHFSKLQRPMSEAYERQMEHENRLGLTSLDTWKRFAQRCHEHRVQVLALLNQHDATRVVGFGASARSSTFLNFCGVSEKQLQAVIDNNPRKQGLFTPGSHIPIVSREKGLALEPEVILILAWNFAEEIMSECRENGFRGVFIRPFPNAPVLLE